MIRFFQILFIICLWSCASFGQTKTCCFEIKYLDFFGLDTVKSFAWPSSQLDGLLLTDFSSDKKLKGKKTNFLIPFIILQLREYYPDCSTQFDMVNYEKLKRLYFKIRQSNLSSIDGKSLKKQLEYIRSDFYSQVTDALLLPYMSYTLDDGPFYGQVSKYTTEFKKGVSYKTDFGTLMITKHLGRIFITAFTNRGKDRWTRIMIGNFDRVLTDLNFIPKKVHKHSLGYTVRMYSESEILTLYLKNNGDFKYYFHSW